MLNAFLEFYTQHQWVALPLAMLSAVGVGLMWMGWLTLMITAFGQKLWVWGFAILLLPVPASQCFALSHKDLNPWANRLVLWGLVLSLPILALTAWWGLLALQQPMPESLFSH